MADELEKEQAAAAEGETTEAPTLLDDIVNATNIKPKDEGYLLTKEGVKALIPKLFEPDRKVEKISNAVIDDMIAEIDQTLSRQLDAVLHNAEFQKLESSWRSVKYLVDKTDFRENIRLEVLNVSKEDLLADFEDSPEIVKSGRGSTGPFIRPSTASLAASLTAISSPIMNSLPGPRMLP